MFESIFKRGINNLRFALNLDDYIPRHIMEELRGGEKFLVREEKVKSVSKGERMFPLLRPKLDKSGYDGYKQEQIKFEDIIGFEDLKELLTKCLDTENSRNVLLSGPPASSKTAFLLSIQREFSNTCFIDATNASGAWFSRLPF